MARGMFNINDPDAGPVKVTIGETSLPGEVDYGTIPSDLIRDEIAETAFIRDFVTTFKDKLEGKDPSEYSEWIRVLGDYATGNAELSDLEAVDVSGLMDVEGFEDYYYGVVPRPLTEDTEEKDPRLLEAIQTYGQEAVDDALAKIQELEAILGKAIDDPFGTLEGIITSTSSGTSSCQAAGPEDWVLDCVTVGVTLPFPLPLPGPLGGIFKGATVRDIVETVQSAGHEIGKVLSGETSVEEVLDDLGDWIGEKVQGVLGDKDKDGAVTIESVLGAIGGFLPNIAAGVIWSTFQNQIEKTLNLPILLTTEEGTEDSRCRDAEGNLTPWGKRNPGSCGQSITFEESDLFGTGGLDSTVECTEGTLDTKGNCVCPDGTLEDADGKCADTVVDTEVVDTEDVDEEGDPRCSDKAFAERNPRICGGQITFTEGPTFGDGTADDDIKGTDVDEEGDPRCLDPAFAARNPRICGGQITFTEGGSTDDDIKGTGVDTEIGDGDDECAVIDSSNYFKCGYLDCFNDGTPGPFVKESEGFKACPSGDGGGDTTTKVECPEGMYNPADGSSYADSLKDCKSRSDVVITGTDGETPVTEDDTCDDPFAKNSGEIGECGECISGYSRKPGQTKCSKDKVIEDPEGTGGPTYTCNDPNATTNSDGSCGPCKVGYTFNSDLELCAPNPYDPCIDAEYARDNPTQCGTVDPECNDCTCAEYAADNPEECGTGGGGTGGGGGGGGGGAAGGSGMFDLESFEITGDPQLLAKMEFPITDFLSGMFKDYV
jgi:hypothetical protein